jgi:hypothetical protein
MAFADVNGGLDLSAMACNTGVGASRTFSFDCANPGTPQSLFGCFQVTTTQDSFVGVEAVLELMVNDPGLPDWWHFEGCNSTGVTLTHVRPSLPAFICTGTIDPWSSTTTSGLVFAPVGSPVNRGRFVVSVARPSSEPFKLDACINYFGFKMDFFSDNAFESGGACAGCGLGASLAWTSAGLTNVRNGGQGSPYSITGEFGGLFGNCVNWNGSSSCPVLGRPAGQGCGPTSARNNTWGQLKSLYR